MWICHIFKGHLVLSHEQSRAYKICVSASGKDLCNFNHLMNDLFFVWNNSYFGLTWLIIIIHNLHKQLKWWQQQAGVLFYSKQRKLCIQIVSLYLLFILYYLTLYYPYACVHTYISLLLHYYVLLLWLHLKIHSMINRAYIIVSYVCCPEPHCKNKMTKMIAAIDNCDDIPFWYNRGGRSMINLYV